MSSNSFLVTPSVASSPRQPPLASVAPPILTPDLIYLLHSPIVCRPQFHVLPILPREDDDVTFFIFYSPLDSTSHLDPPPLCTYPPGTSIHPPYARVTFFVFPFAYSLPTRVTPLLSSLPSLWASSIRIAHVALSPFPRAPDVLTEVCVVRTYTTHLLAPHQPPLIPKNYAHAYYTSAHTRPNSRSTSLTSMVCPFLITLFTGV